MLAAIAAPESLGGTLTLTITLTDSTVATIANPKGPKYLYGTKYCFCSSNFPMVWVSIPHMGT